MSQLPCASVSKRVFIQDLSYENEFGLHENESVGETHFHMNGFAGRLILTESKKSNSPFPSCLKPLYQSEAWCTTIHMKMTLIYM